MLALYNLLHSFLKVYDIFFRCKIVPKSITWIERILLRQDKHNTVGGIRHQHPLFLSFGLLKVVPNEKQEGSGIASTLGTCMGKW